MSLTLRQEPGSCLGALSVYDPTPVGAASVQAASIRVDDALTHTVLNVPGSIADDEVPAVPMFDEADFLFTVHQAMGVVSAALAYELSDAVTLPPGSIVRRRHTDRDAGAPRDPGRLADLGHGRGCYALLSWCGVAGFR